MSSGLVLGFRVQVLFRQGAGGKVLGGVWLILIRSVKGFYEDVSFQGLGFRV